MKEKIERLRDLQMNGVFTKPFIQDIISEHEILGEIEAILAAPLEHSFILAGETFKEIADFMTDFSARNDGVNNPIIEDAVLKTTFIQVVLGLDECLVDALPILMPVQDMAFTLEKYLKDNDSYVYFIKMYENFLRNRSDLFTISRTLVMNTELMEQVGGFEEKLSEYAKNLQGFKPE